MTSIKLKQNVTVTSLAAWAITLVQPSRQHKLKSILLWLSPERIEAAIFGVGHDAFIKNGCKFSDCEIIKYNK